MAGRRQGGADDPVSAVRGATDELHDHVNSLYGWRNRLRATLSGYHLSPADIRELGDRMGALDSALRQVEGACAVISAWLMSLEVERAADGPAPSPPAPTLTPYIVVSDARAAIEWYGEVFGARRHADPHVNADGTVGHAEIAIGDAVLMLSEPSDLWPDVPVRAPDSPTTFSHTLHLEVDNVDAASYRARSRGASVEREPAEQPYGRAAVIVDPFGHRWLLLSPARQRDSGAAP